MSRDLPQRGRQPEHTSGGSSNENDVGKPDDFESMSRAELIHELKERGKPFSGLNKAGMVERLRQSEEEPRPATRTLGRELEWVTVCRPIEDIEAEEPNNDSVVGEPGASWFGTGPNAGLETADVDNEDEEEEQEDEEEDEDNEHKHPKNKHADGKCMCLRQPKDFPEWGWTMSQQARKKNWELMKEYWMRNQDAHGVHDYNDWTGYGVQELIENELVAIDKDIQKNDINLLWPHIEALAIFLQDGSDEWWMTDDPDSVLAALQAIGCAVLTALAMLEQNNNIGPSSSVLNIATTLGGLQQAIRQWPGDSDEDELLWISAALLKAKRAGVSFDKAHRVFSIVNDLEEDSYAEDALDRWAEFDWKKNFANFKKAHSKGRGGGIGGTNYVLVNKAGKLKPGHRSYM